MRFRRLVARLTFTLSILITLGSVYANAQAPNSSDASTFRVGLKSVVVGSPSTDLVEPGSDFRVIFEVFVPTTNRLVAAFLLPEELRATLKGTTPLSRYAFVQVPRRAEFAAVTPEIFKQIAGSMGQEFAASMDTAVKDSQDEMNRRLKALNANPTTLTLDKPLMLGSFFSKPDAVGFGSVMPYDVNGKMVKLAAAVSVVRVQERVLFLYLYTIYKDQESVNWVRTTSEKWADTILAANR
jgi:hypothetical protein